MILRPVVRGPMAVVLPRSCSSVPPPPGRFGRATADYVDRPQAALGSRHRLGTAPGPAGDRPSPFAPRRRSSFDHTGKSSYSGEIDYRFLTFQTGSRFSGSRLTSLVQDLCLNIYHVQLAVNLHHTFSYVADSICNIVVLDKATWYRPIVCFM